MAAICEGIAANFFVPATKTQKTQKTLKYLFPDFSASVINSRFLK
jgi:hypothetical protein